MAQKVYIVEGRQFRTEAEYRRALKDKQVIDRLRAEVDFQNRSQLSQLVKVLQEKKYPFLTLLGQDFTEEAEDALRQLSKSPPPRGKRARQAAGKTGASRGKGVARDPSGETGSNDQMEKFVQEDGEKAQGCRANTTLAEFIQLPASTTKGL